MTPPALLKGRSVLVTGASRGLGRAMCVHFAASGADIAFSYSSDDKGATETARLVSEKGVKCLTFKASVLDGEALGAMVREIEKTFGGLDILVNNAGVSQPIPIPLMEESDYDNVMDVNMKGTYMACRAVLPGMIRRKKGIVLNIGSLAGERLIEAPTHYAASKAAVRAFTEALSKEMSRYNIRVNCLAPGLLDEGVAQNLPDYKLEDYLKNVSLKRRGTLDEVAKLACFMISERNSYMDGATILVDGGF